MQEKIDQEKVVKVQIDFTGTQILIYNKDQSIFQQFEDKKIARKLGGAGTKRYMYFEIIDKQLVLWDFVENKDLFF